MQIKNRIILVTGANRGLGKAIVERALELGAAKVYAGARNPKSVKHEDPRVIALELDVTSPTSIKNAAAIATDVNLLINNAGLASSANILGEDLGALENDFAVNFFGPLALIRAMRPTLERTAPAAIVNVLTVAALASFPALSGYSATKAASHSMTQAIRLAMKPKNVHVFAVYPGPIDTDMVSEMTMPKTSPTEVARNIFAGILEDREDIYPDSMATHVGDIYAASPKALERQFAGN